MDDVILVDAHDAPVGAMTKLEAHEKGLLHRALSVFLFHPDGRVMLQRRADGKYHSAGLWTNACCSHPRPGEDTLAAAHRRLREEMGIACVLEEVHAFMYQVSFDNGLTEHEYDHVFAGETDEEPVLNPEEASDWRWIEPDALLEELAAYPERYTYWLGVSFPDVLRAARRA